MSTGDSALFSISDQPDDFSAAPVYKVDHVLEIDGAEEENDKPKQFKGKGKNCFNCGETGHAMWQCSQPHDPRQISRNRATFLTRNEFKRYHVDTLEEGGSFPHITPGAISKKLRKALGLKKDQLPPYIYKMRVLGYPPGWLLEAKVDHSGIEMFDNDGNRIPNADEEEGEIGLTNADYDETKIITYPGFNAWPDPDTIDETEKYGVPELKYLQSKEDFIKSLRRENQMPFMVNKKIKFDENGSEDMETEDIDDINILPEDSRCTFIPPLPDEKDYPPPPPEEGEIMDETPPTSVAENSNDTTSSLPNISTESMPEIDQFKDMSHGRIKSIELGTPALKIHSPYQKLPPPEHFRKDISDVINFENLPDSTGAYEKLKDVLKNVRSKMTVLKGGKMNATI